MTPRIIKRTGARESYLAHLLALDVGDRRLRFGLPASDEAIRGYVERIDLSRDLIFVTDNAGPVPAGAVHLARGYGYAECAPSVLPEHRGRGVGIALLERCILQCRDWGVSELFTHCLADNRAMISLARSRGMRLVCEAGEVDAYLLVPPAPPSGTRNGPAHDRERTLETLSP